MYHVLRPFLFGLDPERAHHFTLALLQWAGNSPLARYVLTALFLVEDPRLEVEAFGIRFKNPVGVAAGYDKNGIAVAGLGGLGFGHVEVGTLTRRPQPGNPRPRIHRIPEATALINHMGFPNRGVEAYFAKVARSGSRRPAGLRVGVNIGKGKDTPLEKAAEDYTALLQQVHAGGAADYVALNVSSPNTPGLRQLQAASALENLLAEVTRVRDRLAPRLPLLVKIAPDLSESEIDQILAAVLASGVDGVIATNTTTSREGLPARWQRLELKGGLSGGPLRERSTAVIGYIARRTEGRLPIVGVGGIAGAAHALEKIRAGAHLLQVYTGLVYAGPGLARSINLGLLRACAAKGAAAVRELAYQPHI